MWDIGVCVVGVWMGFKFMKVSKFLGCVANKAFIATKLVSIVVVIELVFCFKVLMAGFTLKG